MPDLPSSLLTALNEQIETAATKRVEEIIKERGLVDRAMMESARSSEEEGLRVREEELKKREEAIADAARKGEQDVTEKLRVKEEELSAAFRQRESELAEEYGKKERSMAEEVSGRESEITARLAQKERAVEQKEEVLRLMADEIATARDAIIEQQLSLARALLASNDRLREYVSSVAGVQAGASYELSSASVETLRNAISSSSSDAEIASAVSGVVLSEIRRVSQPTIQAGISAQPQG